MQIQQALRPGSAPVWLKRQAYAEYGITQYKTGDYEVVT